MTNRETLKAGYYWAFHLNGKGERLTDDPEIILVCTRGAVQLFGDDYDYEQKNFEIVCDVALVKMTEHEKRSEDWANVMGELCRQAEKYESCMSLAVDERGLSVELNLDTSLATFAEWIPGEGGDIALLRCCETKRVVGVHLPLMRNNLCVQHEGPIRINTGFLKTDEVK